MMEEEQRKQLETACEIVATAFATRAARDLPPARQAETFAKLSVSFKDTLLNLVGAGFGGIVIVEQNGKETNWTNALVGVGTPAGMIELAMGASDLRETAMHAALVHVIPGAINSQEFCDAVGFIKPQEERKGE
jgi:hypothetical protein